MTFWAVPLRDKVPLHGEPCSLTGIPGNGEYQDPCPEEHVYHLLCTSEHARMGQDTCYFQTEDWQLHCRATSRKHRTVLKVSRASLVAQLVKNPPATQEIWVRSLGWEDPLEKGKATHSSILSWRIP